MEVVQEGSYSVSTQTWKLTLDQPRAVQMAEADIRGLGLQQIHPKYYHGCRLRASVKRAAVWCGIERVSSGTNGGWTRMDRSSCRESRCQSPSRVPMTEPIVPRTAS